MEIESIFNFISFDELDEEVRAGENDIMRLGRERDMFLCLSITGLFLSQTVVDGSLCCITTIIYLN